MYCSRGYLFSHSLLKASITVCTVALPIGTASNQPVIGSIMVRALRCLGPLGVLTVQGPTRSTSTLHQGVESIVFGGKCPYFLQIFLLSWHCLHVEQYCCTVARRPGHVNNCLIVASVLVSPGCTRYSWYHATIRDCRVVGTQMRSSLVTSVTSSTLRVE